MAKAPPSAREEWKSYWPLVLVASIGFSFQSVMASGTGLYMEPLGAEFGWSRTQLSSGLSIASVIATVFSPLIGLMIDRWGSRRLTIPGLGLTALVTAYFSQLDGSVMQWFVLWILWALVSSTAKSTVWSTAVTGVFSAGRGLALGVTLSGTALAQAVNPLFTNWLINEYGWRQAYFWTGTGWGGLAFVLCWFFLYDVRDRQRLRARTAPDPDAAKLVLPGLTIPQAWRDRSLWRVAGATLIMMILTIGLMVHQFPILQEAGVSRNDAAMIASLGGIAGIAGKLVTGWLLDRYRANWVGGLTTASTAIAFALLYKTIATPTLITIAVIINGYASGTKLQICGYLTTRYAGLLNFGAIFGFMASLIAAGSGLGPVLGGAIYDFSGSYTVFLLLGVVGSLFSGWLILGLAPYPKWEAAGAAGPEPREQRSSGAQPT